MTRRGRFITVEGVDGAGKSTHLQFIADCVSPGRHVIVTREPGGTDLAEQLRRAILGEPLGAVAETLLIFAARADHVARVILPALEAGSWVVCDRFSDATFAYQGAGKGVPADLIEALCRAAHPDLQPDRTILFDCSYEVASRRLAASGKKLDRFEREDRAFFERVRAAYLARARHEPARVRVVDASLELAAIRKALEKELRLD
jgi:dTMP kinase